ncbi:LLM class flavin-dependent oxidoreductase [Gordonia sp. NPDC003376]
MSRAVEFFGLMESGYPYVPYSADRPHRSIFVDMPGSYYDRMQGQRQIEDQLETLVGLEKLGFDGVAITEQHNGPAGLIPNAMLGAAWLAARTSSVKIMVLGPLLNAYRSPIRLAEEIAAVDTMCQGRLLVGLPMGLGSSYHGLGLNPATARLRHNEGTELLLKALYETEPFSWRGRFFNHEYVNVWPKPAHDIEFVLPSGGSQETLEIAARRRFGYQSQLNDRGMTIKILERFRELCRAEGYDPDPRQSQLSIDIFVSETDASARKEIEAYTDWTYQNYLAMEEYDLFPPGYTSVNSIRGIRRGGWGEDVGTTTFDDVLDNRWIITGSPDTVIAGIDELLDSTGSGRLLVSLDNGAIPAWLVNKSAGLFAEQVLPHFRPDGRTTSETEPRHGYRTKLEYATKRGDLVPKTVVKDGHLVDADRVATDPDGARIRRWPA